MRGNVINTLQHPIVAAARGLAYSKHLIKNMHYKIPPGGTAKPLVAQSLHLFLIKPYQEFRFCHNKRYIIQ